VRPDLLTVAKGLGGGLPVGACIGLGRAAAGLAKGDHGSTFGGNPVSCAAALAVLDVIAKDGLLAHVDRLGATWAEDLRACVGEVLLGVRGRGLWLALETVEGAAPVIETAARERGFLVNATGPDAVRLAPPLVLTDTEAQEFTAALPEMLASAAATTRLTA
jgi:acetylornithine aminotransferase